MNTFLKVASLALIICSQANCDNQSLEQVEPEVFWIATLIEPDYGSNDHGHNEDTAPSPTNNSDNGNSNHTDTDVADNRRQMYEEKEDQKSQSTNFDYDTSHRNESESVAAEPFQIPEIKEQPFISDVITQLEKIRTDPAKCTNLEEKKEHLVQALNASWHQRIFINKDEARKQIAFIEKILDGTLIEKLKSIENAPSSYSLIQHSIHLHQLWPWPHKTFQIPPHTRSAEHAFNELIGINIMKNVELAMSCNSKYLALLDRNSRLDIQKIIEEYHNYTARGDMTQAKQAYNELFRSINKGRITPEVTVSKMAVAAAISRYYAADMQKNYERTVALKQQLAIERENLAPILDEYKNLTSENTDLLATKQLARVQPLEKFLQDPNSWCTLALKNHYLTDQGKEVLTLYGMGAQAQSALGSLLGNELQHAAYSECITAINDVAAQHKETTPLSDLETLIIDQALIGCEAVAAGHIKQAYSFADICWTALECIKGAGEGVLDGLEDIANMILHPLNTAQNFVSAPYTIGYHLGEFLYNAGDISITYLADADKGTEKYNAYYKEISVLCDAIQKQIETKSARELVRAGVGIAVETYLTGKALGSVHKFCKASKIKAFELAQKAKSGEQAILAAEALDVAAAASASEAVFEKTIEKFVVSAEETIKHPVVDYHRVGSALKSDYHHNFSKIIDNFARYAEVFEFPGGDKIKRILYQVEGSLDGTPGIFEWIVDPNKTITHRLFLKGGKITGKPNMYIRK